MAENKRQYVWLARYGATFPGLIEGVGNYDSDVKYPVGTFGGKKIEKVSKIS